MLLIKVISIVWIVSLYISVCHICIQNRYYFRLLLMKPRVFNSSSKFRYRSVNTCVYPKYKENYFGYEYFLLSELNNEVLYAEEYFRVYGIIRPYSDCLLLYKGNDVKTIIELRDRSNADRIREEFRKVYRNILIISNGGVLICQIYLKYMT